MRTFILASEDTRAMVLHIVSRLPVDGKSTIEIRKTTSRRSLAQNSLYRMWVTLIANEIGHNHDEVHEMLRAQFLPVDVIDVLGTTVEVRKSTTKLKVGEFSTFLEKVDFLAGEFGIVLPKPEDQWSAAMILPH